MEYQSTVLSNGIRYIHVPTDRYVAHLAVIINAGARDELSHEYGLAHFIEHVIFKGTSKRKAYHILSRLEDVGGELDAYTTKEDTVVYSSFLKKYFDRAAELTADILINSTFPSKELEKEKEVIFDEINSYFDSPAEQIYDDFENKIFDQHHLGHSILGSKESLETFNKQSVQDFIKRTYNTDQMMICSIGQIPFEKAVNIIEKYFQVIPSNPRKWSRLAFSNYKPFHVEQNFSTHQAHCIVGNQTYDAFHPKRKILLLLNNILGGPGLNSRLNLSLREKYGWVYNIESNYAQYSDIGLWSVYFGSDKSNYEKVLKHLKKELQIISELRLGPKQLNKAKQQIIGQMAMASENNTDMLVAIGKSYMMYNQLDSFEETKAFVNNISSEQIQEVAFEVFNPNQLSVFTFL
ncbi:MAG: insulinase family protein [Bacteroidales bacterium]|nr:insulinase family protein [Bacteroidales bacterium]